MSLDLAGIPQWDKAVPGASPRDSSDPARKLQSRDVLLYRKLTLNCTVIVLRIFKWGPSLNFQLLDIYFILLIYFEFILCTLFYSSRCNCSFYTAVPCKCSQCGMKKDLFLLPFPSSSAFSSTCTPHTTHKSAHNDILAFLDRLPF